MWSLSVRGLNAGGLQIYDFWPLTSLSKDVVFSLKVITATPHLWMTEIMENSNSAYCWSACPQTTLWLISALILLMSLFRTKAIRWICCVASIQWISEQLLHASARGATWSVRGDEPCENVARFWLHNHWWWRQWDRRLWWIPSGQERVSQQSRSSRRKTVCE